MVLKMSIDLKSEGVTDKLRVTYRKEFERLMSRRLAAIGRSIVSELKIAAPTGSTGNLRQGHASEVEGTRLVVFNRVQYSIFRSSGTGPGARPPRPGKFPWDRSLPDSENPPLKRWVRTKGIAQRIRAETNSQRAQAAGASGRRTFKRMTLEEATDAAAFLVARKIKREGTPPNPWFTNTVKRSTPAVFQNLRAAVREWLSNVSGGG